jgi:uncharacterized protein YigE (DUF2233 family)
MARDEPCRTESFRGAAYIVCSFDLTKDDLRIFWRSPDGTPYRTFAAVGRAPRKGQIAAICCERRYVPGRFTPGGENGRELSPISTAALTGPPAQIPNFYKKPN